MYQIPKQKKQVTITCDICAACYELDDKAYTHKHLSLNQRESLLLEVSHFCFRCRRPACPDCWDETHEICAACSQEAHLSAGVAISSPHKDSVYELLNKKQLIHIQAGRYHQIRLNRATSHQSDQATTSISSNSTSGSHSQLNVAQFHRGAVHSSLYQPATTVARHQEKQARLQRGEIALDEMSTIPVPALKYSHKLYRGYLPILALLVPYLIIVGVIVAACLSVDANTYISQTLHIDVRRSIAALWNWLQQLHFSG